MRCYLGVRYQQPGHRHHGINTFKVCDSLHSCSLAVYDLLGQLNQMLLTPYLVRHTSTGTYILIF